MSTVSQDGFKKGKILEGYRCMGDGVSLYDVSNGMYVLSNMKINLMKGDRNER